MDLVRFLVSSLRPLTHPGLGGRGGTYHESVTSGQTPLGGHGRRVGFRRGRDPPYVSGGEGFRVQVSDGSGKRYTVITVTRP